MKTDKNYKGRTFADIASEISGRYKKRTTDVLATKTKDLELKRLVLQNLMKQENNNPAKLKEGGPIGDYSNPEGKGYKNGLGGFDLKFSPQEKNPFELPKLSGDLLQLGASFLPGGYNLLRGLLTKPQEVKPVFNQGFDNANKLLDKQSFQFNDQALINRDESATSLARQQVKDNATSTSSLLGNLQSIQARQAQRLEQLELQKQQARNEFENQRLGQKAQLAVAKGTNDQAVLEAKRQEELLHKSAKQTFIATGLSNMAEGLNRVGQGMNNTLSNEMTIGLLDQAYPNVFLEEIKKFLKGNTKLTVGQ